MHVLRFRNKLNEEICRGFIFANLFNSLYLLVRLWWNILVTNLATNFQDLVAKVKNLVALAPVLGAISCPDLPDRIDTSIPRVCLALQEFVWWFNILSDEDRNKSIYLVKNQHQFSFQWITDCFWNMYFLLAINKLVCMQLHTCMCNYSPLLASCMYLLLSLRHLELLSFTS